MGALAAFTKWNPQDDLTLKNAVEAGASLESLAKGAVPFSCRFTLKELQERWRALLYDLETSTEASSRMIEIDIELVSNPSKPTRNCNAKENGFSFNKRKGDSVRSHYRALRKRICNEPRSSPDLACLMQPGSLHIRGDNALNSHTIYPDDYCLKCAPGDLLNHFGHSETHYDGQHVLPERIRVDSYNAGAIGSAHAFPVEDELPDGMADEDCLYGYEDNVIHSVDGTMVNNADQAFAHDFGEREAPRILGENLLRLKSCPSVEEIGPPQALPMNDMYEDIDMEGKHVPDFDSTNHNHERLCSGVVGEQNLSSQIPECGNSVHQLGYSSPPSGLPIWGGIDAVSTTAMAIDEHFGVKEQGAIAPGILTVDDIEQMGSPGCDGATAGPKAVDGMTDAQFDQSTMMSDSEFDFPSSFMNFSDNDDLFTNVDEEDNPDRPCLDSILLNPLTDTPHDDVPISSDPSATEAFETCLVTSDGACHLESDNVSNEVYTVRQDEQHICVPEASLLCDSSTLSRSAKPSEVFMICVLNTEDPEIPCNDDVVFQPSPPSELRQYSTQISGCLSTKAMLNDGKISLEGLSLAKEEQVVTTQPLTAQKSGSSLLPNACLMHSSDSSRMQAESFDRDSIAGVARNASVDIDDPKSHTLSSVAMHSTPAAAMLEENTARHLGHLESSMETPIQRSNPPKPYSKDIFDICKHESDLQDTPLKSVSLHAAEVAFSGPLNTISVSDQEELSSVSEDDVPNFSDIEAMILDMDLDPYDQESHLLTREVSRYQCMDFKKAIIRLEQGARSYMQRSMAANGAVAIFYGRHLKYFIKSRQVILGRATEDVSVDIDLRREGRANTISRRQASISMDEDGSFCLKNTGKNSIFVNSKEVLATQRINLSSGCLIEIRNMRFIFEINESAVRSYVADLHGSSHERDTRFEWLPS